MTEGAVNRRQCGTCTLCCRLLPVQTIGKPAGVKCVHARYGKGCLVYHKPSEGFPNECGVWSCRWLVDPYGQDLRRPDHAHYVVDIMPDLIGARQPDGSNAEVPVVQVWVDKAHPEAWRDPALLAYLAAENERNPPTAAVIRYSNKEGFILIPPALTDDGKWMVRHGEHSPDVGLIAALERESGRLPP